VEGLIEDVTRGNVVEVKVMLASIVLALAAYQVVLMAVGYGKLRPRFLGAKAASFAHRAIGDAIVVVAVTVALMCVGYFGFEAEEGTRTTIHIIAAIALLAALAVKVATVRGWLPLGRFLPVLGGAVFLLFAITWVTSAGDFLADT